MATRFTFTINAIEKLPLPIEGKRGVYYDQQQRHLMIILTPKGQKTYYVQRTVKGKKYREAIGAYEDLSIKQARDKAGDMASKLASGLNFDQIRGMRKNEPTLQEAWETYLENWAKLRRKTWANDQANFKLHVSKSTIAKLRLSHITNANAQDLHEFIGKNSGPVMANRVIQLLRAVFYRSMTRKETMVDRNPFTGFRLFEEKERERFIQPNELPRFFEALEKCEHSDFKDYVLISLYTGARKTNVLSMQWDQVDLATRNWRLPTTKNGDSLNIPLIPQVVEILTRRSATVIGRHVFPTVRKKSATPYYSSPNKPWVSLMKAAGFMDKDGKWLTESLSFHDLRRSCGSWQTMAGANSFTVGASLGHKDPRSTRIYARLTTDNVRSSLATSADAMGRAFQPKKS